MSTQPIFNEQVEYSHKVDKLRHDRVEMSFYKYGSAKVNFGMKLVDAIMTHDLCIDKYRETGNTEYLLDAMNYLMFEFMYPQKPGAFFKPTDSNGSAGIVGMSHNELKREGEYNV